VISFTIPAVASFCFIKTIKSIYLYGIFPDNISVFGNNKLQTIPARQSIFSVDGEALEAGGDIAKLFILYDVNSNWRFAAQNLE
jgi:hypothetical protein